MNEKRKEEEPAEKDPSKDLCYGRPKLKIFYPIYGFTIREFVELIVHGYPSTINPEDIDRIVEEIEKECYQFLLGNTYKTLEKILDDSFEPTIENLVEAVKDLKPEEILDIVEDLEITLERCQVKDCKECEKAEGIKKNLITLAVFNSI